MIPQKRGSSHPRTHHSSRTSTTGPKGQDGQGIRSWGRGEGWDYGKEKRHAKIRINPGGKRTKLKTQFNTQDIPFAQVPETLSCPEHKSTRTYKHLHKTAEHRRSAQSLFKGASHQQHTHTHKHTHTSQRTFRQHLSLALAHNHTQTIPPCHTDTTGHQQHPQ